MLTTRGIVVPVDWNEEGVAVSFAVSTFEEDQYVLESGHTREEMMEMIREEVEVTGELRIENGKKTIAVARICPRDRAAA